MLHRNLLAPSRAVFDIPPVLLVSIWVRVPHFECDPHIPRRACRKLQELYDQNGGVWQALLKYFSIGLDDEAVPYVVEDALQDVLQEERGVIRGDVRRETAMCRCFFVREADGAIVTLRGDEVPAQ